MGFLKRYHRDVRKTQHKRIYVGKHWALLYRVLRFFNAKRIARWVFSTPRLHYIDITRERNGRITVQHTWVDVKSKARLVLDQFTTTQ